jgi:hypothetical protein
MGFLSVDNGWLRLEHVRIPRWVLGQAWKSNKTSRVASASFLLILVYAPRKCAYRRTALGCLQRGLGMSDASPLAHPVPCREDMLMGQAEVSPDGTYRKRGGGSEKILYGAMLDVRAGLVVGAAATYVRIVWSCAWLCMQKQVMWCALVSFRSEKILYGAMLDVRAGLVVGAAATCVRTALSQAAKDASFSVCLYVEPSRPVCSIAGCG